MDLGYWFLFTLWMISIAFIISKYLTNIIVKQACKLKWGYCVLVDYIPVLNTFKSVKEAEPLKIQGFASFCAVMKCCMEILSRNFFNLLI